MTSLYPVPRIRRRLVSDSFFDAGNIDTSYARYVTQSSTVNVNVNELLPLPTTTSEFTCTLTPFCRSIPPFPSLSAYESHYNSTHRHVCSTCNHILPNSHLLSLHLLEHHDAYFTILRTKQPSLLCLIQHCAQKFWNQAERNKHLLQDHAFVKKMDAKRIVKGVNLNSKYGGNDHVGGGGGSGGWKKKAMLKKKRDLKSRSSSPSVARGSEGSSNNTMDVDIDTTTTTTASTTTTTTKQDSNMNIDDEMDNLVESFSRATSLVPRSIHFGVKRGRGRGRGR